MRAGTLRERVTIQRLTTLTDPRWGKSDNWNDVLTVAADVAPIGGDESNESKGVSTSQRFRVRIRYTPSLAMLSSKDRLRWLGQTLDVTSVTNVDNRNREVVIEAVQHG